MEISPKHVRFRAILPVTYLVISGVLFAGCFLHLGHSSWCQYFLDSMFPAEVLGRLLSRALVHWAIITRDSAAWPIFDDVIAVPLPFLFTVTQYYLIGLLIDGFLSRRRK